MFSVWTYSFSIHFQVTIDFPAFSLVKIHWIVTMDFLLYNNKFYFVNYYSAFGSVNIGL